MVHFLFSQLTKEMRDYQLLRISCASVFVCVSSGQKVLLVTPTVVVRGTKCLTVDRFCQHDGSTTRHSHEGLDECG